MLVASLLWQNRKQEARRPAASSSLSSLRVTPPSSVSAEDCVKLGACVSAEAAHLPSRGRRMSHRQAAAALAVEAEDLLLERMTPFSSPLTRSALRRMSTDVQRQPLAVVENETADAVPKSSGASEASGKGASVHKRPSNDRERLIQVRLWLLHGNGCFCFCMGCS